MIIIITKKQKQLLEFGIKKGILNYEDFFKFYKSEQEIKNTIKRLIEGELIVRTKEGWFYILTDEFEAEKIDNPISKSELNLNKTENGN